MSAKAATGLGAVALMAALSSACGTQHGSPKFDDSRLPAHVAGEQIDVETINSRATYQLSFPHVKDGVYTVNLAIDCVECTKWMPGQLALVMDDGSKINPADSSIDMVKYLTPLENRRGHVSFNVDNPGAIDRVVLMRGEPLAPVAKWKIDQNKPVPTLDSKAPVEVVALGDQCSKPEDTAETADGRDAYCSRLDYTNTYLWAAARGTIPNEPVITKAPVVAAPTTKPTPPPAVRPAPPPPIFVLPPPPWLR